MSAGSRKGALIFGVILICIGLAFFLSNWYSTLRAWQLVARYWPVLLILVGAKKLYFYFTWQEEPAAADPAARRLRRRRPSLLGGLLWAALGIVFLLKNFGIGPDLWAIARRYWPILLILLGLGKVIDYFRQKEGVSLKIGEVFGILFVLIIGLAISQIPDSAMKDILSTSINIGGTDVFIGTSHEYTQEFTYPLPAGIPLRIENSHGLVTVSPGSDGEVRIRLRKRVYEDDEARARQIADEIKIEGGEEGKAEASSFTVKSNRDDLSSKNYRFNTDMEILVPRKVQLDIQNPFGGVNVSGLDCKLNVQSSHQPLEVRECSGSFSVANSYGESRLANLTGNLSVDSHGRVTVETVKGDVDIRDQYSPVQINDIEGKVTVANEEGGIVIDHVSKPVIIDARGSQISVSNLGDSLKITSSHSRRIRVTDVAANVTLSSQYATATMKGVKGNVDVDANSGSVTLNDVGGYVKATAQGALVQVTRVGGPVEISTTLKEVIVNDFSKGCKVTNERGDVTLSTATLGKDEINVKNSNGEITLSLPPNSVFQIDATARNGRISTDFAGLEPTSGPGDITTIKKLKPGAPKIFLETENNDIFVRALEVERASRRDK
ncbi:MAG: DUF5668 domain-containing protein [Acidobacteriia bacterium]|nr:DUF5668 domain-containing protein [Terriglobia bacterium]